MTPERLLAFRLALKLGYANPEYMLSVMPYRIWRDWIEYHSVEPFGEERGFVFAADARGETPRIVASAARDRVWCSGQYAVRDGVVLHGMATELSLT